MSNFSPVFIGGVGRSGTTLVADMLGLHSRVTPIYETHFVLRLVDVLVGDGKITDPLQASVSIEGILDRWSKPLPHRPDNKRAHEQYHHGAHHILFSRKDVLEEMRGLVCDLTSMDRSEAFRVFISRLFARQCVLAGKPYWVNKTPAYVSVFPVLFEIFPGARFVHCVRDGRDVALSVLTRPWGPSTFEEAALWWSSKVSAAADFGRQRQQSYVEVRYEDLVSEPLSVLPGLFEWLGLDDESQRIIHRHYGPSSSVSLTDRRIGKWRTDATRQQIVDFERVAGRQLERFGYA
jgi:hypothetical protein